jgi:hypothetical protein
MISIIFILNVFLYIRLIYIYCPLSANYFNYLLYREYIFVQPPTCTVYLSPDLFINFITFFLIYYILLLKT